MIKIIHDPTEMRSLAGVWNELADRSKNPLLRHEWFSACAEAFCLPGQLLVAANDSGSGIDSLAPLALTHRHGITNCELLGASVMGEPCGLIYKDDAALEASIIDIIQMGRPVLLSRLGSESPEVSMLRKMNKRGALVLVRNGIGAPFLPITQSWTDYEAAMTSRQRYDLRRARKRAETLGDVQFEIVSPDPDTVDHYLADVFQVEAAGWKGRNGTAMLFDERLKRFFQIYSRAACGLGTLRVCLLKINRKTAAVMLAVEYFNRFWVLKIGYDEEFSRCSPGILLLHETIRYAFEKKLDAYEFLGSHADWIHMWTEQQHPYVTVRIYPFSISGQFSLCIDTTFALGNRALKMVHK